MCSLHGGTQPAPAAEFALSRIVMDTIGEIRGIYTRNGNFSFTARNRFPPLMVGTLFE